MLQIKVVKHGISYKKVSGGAYVYLAPRGGAIGFQRLSSFKLITFFLDNPNRLISVRVPQTSLPLSHITFKFLLSSFQFNIRIFLPIFCLINSTSYLQNLFLILVTLTTYRTSWVASHKQGKVYGTVCPLTVYLYLD